jgi:DNA-binding CsgD family transcriptional regulator
MKAVARPSVTVSPEREADSNGETARLETPSLHLLTDEIKYLSWALDSLTDREREVVFTICAGGTNEGMADRLCIALPTLRTHLMRLNQKLGTTSKGDVVRFVAATLLRGYRRGEITLTRAG